MFIHSYRMDTWSLHVNFTRGFFFSHSAYGFIFHVPFILSLLSFFFFANTVYFLPFILVSCMFLLLYKWVFTLFFFLHVWVIFTCDCFHMYLLEFTISWHNMVKYWSHVKSMILPIRVYALCLLDKVQVLAFIDIIERHCLALF